MKSDHDDGAEALEALDPDEEAALLRALRSVFRPESIRQECHEALLETALLDPFAEPTAEERARAEELRAALAGGTPHQEADLARQLAAAFRAAPAGVAAKAAQRASERALPRGKVVQVAFAATVVLSLAAGALLLVRGVPERAPELAPLAESRSLSPLFARAPEASASERLDRIVAVRSRELRDNRFATWGVR